MSSGRLGSYKQHRSLAIRRLIGAMFEQAVRDLNSVRGYVSTDAYRFLSSKRAVNYMSLLMIDDPEMILREILKRHEANNKVKDKENTERIILVRKTDAQKRITKLNSSIQISLFNNLHDHNL